MQNFPEDLDDTYDGFTPSQISPDMAQHWAKANHRRYYAPKVRLEAILTAMDVWWHRHPILVSVAGATVIIVGIIAAVNLELGRPWF